MAEARQVAVQWLTSVVQDGISVNHLLAGDHSRLAPEHIPLAKQILFGCLRYYHQLNTLTDNLIKKPFKAKDTDLKMLLITGLYQMKYLSTPDHAAISETVELAKKLKKNWATGLVNGVLRNYQREKEPLEKSLQKSVQFKFSHPGWIAKQLRSDWPIQADDILQQNNQQAPMTLRINSRQINREDYLLQLEAANLEANPHPLAMDAMVLNNACDVFKLPGFSQGLVTIQDAAPQLAVEMLDIQAGQKILDGCAAPGGKTTHILQRGGNVDLTAVEMSPRRAEKIGETLKRLNLQCQVKVADICEHESWWDGQLFDRILLDVPCSASGVIRRNPDIKIHRRTTDTMPLVTIQQEILKQSWSLLKPGGRLVYATCSLFKAENQQQVETFLATHDAELLTMPLAIHAKLNSAASVGYQIFPGEFEMDGFYLCGLKKPE